MTDLEKAFELYIDDWKYYIAQYGIDTVNVTSKSTPQYSYHFEVMNGAFREETIEFNFQYFRALDSDELMKFIFRSLSDHKSTWEFSFKKKKFVKQMICY